MRWGIKWFLEDFGERGAINIIENSKNRESSEPEYNNWLSLIGWVTPDEFAYDETIYQADGKSEKIRKSVKC